MVSFSIPSLIRWLARSILSIPQTNSAVFRAAMRLSLEIASLAVNPPWRWLSFACGSQVCLQTASRAYASHPQLSAPASMSGLQQKPRL
jgi:hypothetical protein